MKTLNVFSYAYGNAAEYTGCAAGPHQIQRSHYTTELGLNLHWLPLISTEDSSRKDQAEPVVQNLCTSLAKLTFDATTQRDPFVVLGGDHSSAIGTWSGVSDAIQEQGQLGLIWFDAHLDSHTPETTLTHNIHGMPLACLLGRGHKALTEILSTHQKLQPENVVVIGARSYEEAEHELLKQLGVKIIYMQEIINKGFSPCLEEAIDHVTQNTAGFGISIDLDGIDPEEAPGVGTPEKNGVHKDDLLKALPLLRQHKQFIACEIAEFNPEFDAQEKTEKIVFEIINQLYGDAHNE